MDLALGHLSELNYLILKKPQFIAINLGTGIDTSVIKFIRTFKKVNKVKVTFNFEDRCSRDISTLIADNL